MTERTYIIPVSTGILERKHREQIGSALWLFLWMIDRSTANKPAKDGSQPDALVLNGRPITVQFIASEIGESARSVRYHLHRLEHHGYIRVLETTGYASSYVVTKSKKRFSGDSAVFGPDADWTDPGKNLQAPPATFVEKCDETCSPNKDTQHNNTNNIPANAGEPGTTTPRKEVDPRRKDFLEAIDRHLKRTIPDEQARPQFKSFIRALDTFMETYKKLQPDGFRQWLTHRAESDNAKLTANPRIWLQTLSLYANGPLDRWGQLKTQKQLKAPASVPPSTFPAEQRRKRELAAADRNRGLA